MTSTENRPYAPTQGQKAEPMMHSSVAQPMPDTQKPGTFFLTFQRQLAASGQIEVLAGLLAHVHFLYEGWGQVALPLDGELKRIYSKAACMAVRACSDVEQQVARGKAERWALDNYMRFRMQQLKTTDHEESLQLLRDFVRAILDEHRFCLMHGPEVASVRDTLQMAEIMADDLGEPA